MMSNTSSGVESLYCEAFGVKPLGCVRACVKIPCVRVCVCVCRLKQRAVVVQVYVWQQAVYRHLAAPAQAA